MNYSSINNVESNCYIGDEKATPLTRRILDGNWMIYLIIALITSSVVFAPLPFNKAIMEAREIQPFGPFMKMHLFASFTISFVCLWNIFHTPSHGEIYKKVHRWLGRVGLISSMLGAVCGFVVAFFERKVPLAQGLGLTVLGIFQIYWTIRSYHTIREKINLHGDPTTKEYQEKEKEIIERHKEAVLRLWMCCLVPAWARIPQILGASSNSPLMFITFLLPTPYLFGVNSALNRGSFW